MSNNLEHAARQTKAATKKRRNKAAMRRARKAKPYQRVAVTSPEQVRARIKADRFEVADDREWVIVRTEQNRASRCAQLFRDAGLPVFEARQEERLVAENGKARVAQVPVLRRLLFVGVAEDDALADLGSNRFVEALWSMGEDSWIWVPREWMASARPIRIGPKAMQKFADHITGHRRDGKLTPDLIMAAFEIGEHVSIVDGPLNGHSGPVERVDAVKGRYTVAATIFGQATLVELGEKQLEAA